MCSGPCISAPVSRDLKRIPEPCLPPLLHKPIMILLKCNMNWLLKKTMWFLKECLGIRNDTPCNDRDQSKNELAVKRSMLPLRSLYRNSLLPSQAWCFLANVAFTHSFIPYYFIQYYELFIFIFPFVFMKQTASFLLMFYTIKMCFTWICMKSKCTLMCCSCFFLYCVSIESVFNALIYLISTVQ